jgi:hypothetical protein
MPSKEAMELLDDVWHILQKPNVGRMKEAAEMLDTALAEREAQAVQREQEKAEYTNNVLLHEDDDGNIGGHMVVGCSGGADYVGDIETGYPRRIMVAPVKGEGHATYYHESVVQREREAAKGLYDALENIAAYYDDEMGRAVIPDWVEKKRLMENYHEIISKANAALATYNDNRKG